MARRRAALRDGDRDTYKQLNRQVQSAVRRDTREGLDRQMRQAGPGAMWRSVRPIIAPKRSARSTPSADADAMNRYFVEVGLRTADRPPGDRRGAGAAGAPASSRVATGGFCVADLPRGPAPSGGENAQQHSVRC